ncbi:MAG: glycosyltransferase family 2 protein [Gammaproteobacteria bacterium]|nr:glycosyltransferase family 2 protein [Gammaproteobacteria bacterium]
MESTNKGYSRLKKSVFTSVIITTYNWPSALDKVLCALKEQTDAQFEIIVADDGSSNETARCVDEAKRDHPIHIEHIWQPDTGFQAAKIRNKAVSKARGDYLVFIDGDCIPLHNFIQRHRLLAEQNWFVAGNRTLLSEQFTHRYLLNDNLALPTSLYQWFLLWKDQYCNRLQPLLFFPLLPRKFQAKKWQGAKTCNLGVWRKDFLTVNGFDESYQGWGYEDSDLVIRLIKSGVGRKDGRFAVPVVHLWHKEQGRAHAAENLIRCEQRLTDNVIKANIGVTQYLEN